MLRLSKAATTLAAWLLLGAAAPLTDWDPGDPDRAFQVGAWSVSCARDGNLHGVYVERCGAKAAFDGVSVSFGRDPATLTLSVRLTGCPGQTFIELPAANFDHGISGRAERLSGAVREVTARGLRSCGKAVKMDARLTHSHDLERLLKQTDGLIDHAKASP